MEHAEYNYWLSNIKNIGPRKIEALLQIFGSAEEVFHVSDDTLMKLKEGCLTDTGASLFGEEDLEAVISSRNIEKVQRDYSSLCKNGIQFITKEDKRYPDKLRQIYAAPFSLYVKGSLPSDSEKCLAVVGARDCSLYGKEMAKYLAGAAAKAGLAIISGLARGIDSYSHQGALAAGGKTYAILGCGIDICYPRENIELYMDMQEHGGIISEYAPGTKPWAGNFPMRNRIISGLSDAILVIEARLKSGSLITVDMGLEQGKDIYALPGKATDALSEGCNNLIKMGAKLVTEPKDILEDLLPGYSEASGQPELISKSMSATEERINSFLEADPKHIEELAMLTGLSVDCLVEQLLSMELHGQIRQTMKNYYCKALR